MTIINIPKIPVKTLQPLTSTSGISHSFRTHLHIPSCQAFKEKVYDCLLRFQSSLSEECGFQLLTEDLSSEDGGNQLTVSLGPPHLQQSVPGVRLYWFSMTLFSALSGTQE